jgi:hypothetical protein
LRFQSFKQREKNQHFKQQNHRAVKPIPRVLRLGKEITARALCKIWPFCQLQVGKFTLTRKLRGQKHGFAPRTNGKFATLRRKAKTKTSQKAQI